MALSTSFGLQRSSNAPIFRMAIAFGLAQAIMPALGWLVGKTVVNFVAGYDHWVAFALLMLIGGRMIWESFRPSQTARKIDASKGLLLITLAIATSIDALAVGLSFAFLKVNIAIACSVIGLIAFGITIAGFMLGKRVKSVFGKYAEVVGGIILIAIGLRILLSHLL